MYILCNLFYIFTFDANFISVAYVAYMLKIHVLLNSTICVHSNDRYSITSHDINRYKTADLGMMSAPIRPCDAMLHVTE